METYTRRIDMNKYKALWQDYYDQVVSIEGLEQELEMADDCLLYTSPSPRDGLLSRMPSSA